MTQAVVGNVSQSNLGTSIATKKKRSSFMNQSLRPSFIANAIIFGYIFSITRLECFFCPKICSVYKLDVIFMPYVMPYVNVNLLII